MSRIHDIPLLKLLYFTCTNDVEYSETDRNYKWLLIVKENLKKNPINFSSTHVRICVKDATPLAPCEQNENIERSCVDEMLCSASQKFRPVP